MSLTGVLVNHNTAFAGGGILNNGNATLILNAGTIVTANTARKTESTGSGAGIYNNGTCTLILKAGSAVTDNIANAQTLGGGIYDAGTLTRDPGSNVSGNTPSDCRNSNGTTC